MTDQELPLRDQIAKWRAGAVANTLTVDEMRKAIEIMRQGRVGASETSARAKVKAAPIDADKLLDDL